MDIAFPQQLLDDSDSQKTSHYVTLDSADHKKNELLLKQAMKDLEVSDELRSRAGDLAAHPHSTASIGFFSEEGTLQAVEPLPVGCNHTGKDSRYFVLPFFDYRSTTLQSMALFTLSLHEVKLYQLKNQQLEEIKVEGLQSFEEATKLMQEQKSVQMHQAADTIHHGQNAAENKGSSNEMVAGYLSEVASQLSPVLQEHGLQLVIAAPREHIDILSDKLQTNQQFVEHMEGNFEHSSEFELMQHLIKLINVHAKQIMQDEVSDQTLKDSQKLHNEGFASIMSTINDGKVDRIIIGRLGEYDAEYENPVSANGANYIAQEAIRLGGEVVYFPETEFEASDNNLLFKLRF